MNTWLFALRRDPVCKSAHHQLFAALGKDGEDWKSSEPRKVQFVELEGTIIARATQKPKTVPSKEYSLSVSAGDTLDIRVLLPGMKRERYHVMKNGDTYSRKSCAKTDQEMQDSIPAWLERMGCTGTVAMVRQGVVRMARPLPSVEAWTLQGTVTVLDAERFMQAWTYGIGRLRTYGFGMIREQKR